VTLSRESCAEPSGDQGEFREWSDASGKFRVEAKLIQIADKRVTLERKDGRQVTVPIERLSGADQAYLLAKSAPAKSAPVARSAAGGRRGAEPPLAEANSAQWQAAPDAGGPLGEVAAGLKIESDAFAPQVVWPSAAPWIVSIGGRSTNSVFKVWDVRTGKQIGTVTPGFSWYPTVSTDGSLFAASDQQGAIDIYSVASGKREQHIPADANDRPSYLEFCKSDVLVGVLSNKIAIWEARSGKPLGEHPFAARGSSAFHFAASPGGNYFAAVDSWGKKIELIDTRNGNRAGQLALTDEIRTTLVGISFAPGGEEIAALLSTTSGVSNQMKVVAWNMATGAVADEISIEDLDKSMGRLFRYECRPIEFLPDYGWLVLGRAVIKRVDKKVVSVLGETNERRSRLRRVLNSQQFASVDTSSRGSVITIDPVPWDQIETGERLVASGATVRDSGLPALAKLDRSKAVSISASVAVPSWQYRPPERRGLFTTQPIALPVLAGSVRSILFSDQHAFLSIAGAGQVSLGPSDSAVVRCDLQSSKQAGQFSPSFPSELLDVSPNGERLLFRAAGDRDRLDIWSFDKGISLVGFRPLQDHAITEKSVRWACFIDDDHVITQDAISNLTLWKIPECQAIYEVVISLPQRDSFGRLQTSNFDRAVRSPSRRHVALFALGKFYLIEAKTGRVVGTLTPPGASTAGVAAMAFNSAETLLACISTTDLVTWDLSSGQVRDRFPIPLSAQGLWWADDRQILVRGLNWNKERATLDRLTLLDLDKGLIGWHYDLQTGEHARESPDGQAWFVVSDNPAQQGVLRSVRLPHDEAAQAIKQAAKQSPTLGSGALCNLDIAVRLIDKGALNGEAEAKIRQAVTDSLVSAGITVGQNADAKLITTVDEVLAEQKAKIGVGAGAAVVDITQLVCQLQVEFGGKVVWEEKQAFSTPKQLPKKLDANIGIAQQLKGIQWSSALAWLGKTLPKLPLYPESAFDGLGTSSLATSGVGPALPAAPTSKGTPGGRRGSGRRGGR
jgi:WD40 repeat protein